MGAGASEFPLLPDSFAARDGGLERPCGLRPEGHRERYPRLRKQTGLHLRLARHGRGREEPLPAPRLRVRAIREVGLRSTSLSQPDPDFPNNLSHRDWSKGATVSAAIRVVARHANLRGIWEIRNPFHQKSLRRLRIPDDDEVALRGRTELVRPPVHEDVIARFQCGPHAVVFDSEAAEREYRGRNHLNFG